MNTTKPNQEETVQDLKHLKPLLILKKHKTNLNAKKILKLFLNKTNIAGARWSTPSHLVLEEAPKGQDSNGSLKEVDKTPAEVLLPNHGD